MAYRVADVSEQSHEHCWHATGGFTQGDGRGGSTNQTCCHCGERRTREWRTKPDPAHGPYAPDVAMIRCYVDEQKSARVFTEGERENRHEYDERIGRQLKELLSEGEPPA